MHSQLPLVFKMMRLNCGVIPPLPLFLLNCVMHCFQMRGYVNIAVAGRHALGELVCSMIMESWRGEGQIRSASFRYAVCHGPRLLCSTCRPPSLKSSLCPLTSSIVALGLCCVVRLAERPFEVLYFDKHRYTLIIFCCYPSLVFNLPFLSKTIYLPACNKKVIKALSLFLIPTIMLYEYKKSFFLKHSTQT